MKAGELAVVDAQRGHGFEQPVLALASRSPELLDLRIPRIARLALLQLNRSYVPVPFLAESGYAFGERSGRPVGARQVIDPKCDQVGQAAGLGLLDVDEGRLPVGLAAALER